MKKLFILLSLWSVISLTFLSSCKCCKKHGSGKEEKVMEHPRPVTEPITDSLKYQLDKERENRKLRNK